MRGTQFRLPLLPTVRGFNLARHDRATGSRQIAAHTPRGPSSAASTSLCAEPSRAAATLARAASVPRRRRASQRGLTSRRLIDTLAQRRGAGATNAGGAVAQANAPTNVDVTAAACTAARGKGGRAGGFGLSGRPVDCTGRARVWGGGASGTPRWPAAVTCARCSAAVDAQTAAASGWRGAGRGHASGAAMESKFALPPAGPKGKRGGVRVRRHRGSARGQGAREGRVRPSAVARSGDRSVGPTGVIPTSAYHRDVLRAAGAVRRPVDALDEGMEVSVVRHAVASTIALPSLNGAPETAADPYARSHETENILRPTASERRAAVDAINELRVLSSFRGGAKGKNPTVAAMDWAGDGEERAILQRWMDLYGQNPVSDPAHEEAAYGADTRPASSRSGRYRRPRQPRPDRFAVAAAFALLDSVGNLFGRYGPVLGTISGVLRAAVYKDSSPFPQEQLNDGLPGVATASNPTARVPREGAPKTAARNPALRFYYAKATFFDAVRDVEAQTQTVVALQEQLNKFLLRTRAAVEHTPQDFYALAEKEWKEAQSDTASSASSAIGAAPDASAHPRHMADAQVAVDEMRHMLVHGGVSDELQHGRSSPDPVVEPEEAVRWAKRKREIAERAQAKAAAAALRLRSEVKRALARCDMCIEQVREQLHDDVRMSDRHRERRPGVRPGSHASRRTTSSVIQRVRGLSPVAAAAEPIGSVAGIGDNGSRGSVERRGSEATACVDDAAGATSRDEPLPGNVHLQESGDDTVTSSVGVVGVRDDDGDDVKVIEDLFDDLSLDEQTRAVVSLLRRARPGVCTGTAALAFDRMLRETDVRLMYSYAVDALCTHPRMSAVHARSAVEEILASSRLRGQRGARLSAVSSVLESLDGGDRAALLRKYLPSAPDTASTRGMRERRSSAGSRPAPTRVDGETQTTPRDTGEADPASEYEEPSIDASVATAVAESLPWTRYLQHPPVGTKARKVNVDKLLRLVYGCYETKIASDAAADAAGMRAFTVLSHRVPIARVFEDYLLSRLGDPSGVEASLFGVARCVRRCKDSKRLRLFGRLCGLVEPDRYNPYACDIILTFYQTVFPRFTASTLSTRKEGQCKAGAAELLRGLQAAFAPETRPFVPESTRLTGERAELLDRICEQLRGQVGVFVHGKPLQMDVDTVLDAAWQLIAAQHEANVKQTCRVITSVVSNAPPEAPWRWSLPQLDTLLRSVLDVELTEDDLLQLFKAARDRGGSAGVTEGSLLAVLVRWGGAR